jgi:hypothetical protein
MKPQQIRIEVYYSGKQIGTHTVETDVKIDDLMVQIKKAGIARIIRKFTKDKNEQ